MTAPLAHDRALAMAALFPRQTSLVYEELTRSAQAEVTRVVALIAHVRAETPTPLPTTQDPTPLPLPLGWPCGCGLPAGHDGRHDWVTQ